MPIYQYRCQSCSELHEALQKVSDERLTTCPHCGEEALKRIIAPVGIQFKGSGWHVTDYKSSAPKSTSDEGGKDKKKSEDTSKSSEGSKSEGSKSGEGSKGSDTSKGSGDASASSKVA